MMKVLTVGVLVATVSVIVGSPMPNWSSPNGGGSGNRYGNNYQNNNRASYQQPQQQYTTAAASGYQQNQQTYTTQQYNQYPTTQQASYTKPAAASYQPQSYGGSSYSSNANYYGPQAQLYQGRYYGQCNSDGFYYNDLYSLVFCTNGIAYVQQCARGSQNLDASQYVVGVDTYVSFCNVNLVDNGAGASSYVGSSYGSSSSGYTQKQTYVPIYPQQPSIVAYPAASQSYQPSSYPQQSSGSY